ncbi:MAG TPA: rRNA maturation RNase YbeY [Polyangia bacterium]|jgi:probable rRNA maturation factor
MPVDLLVRPSARDAVPPAVRRALKVQVTLALRRLARQRSSVAILLTDDIEIRALNRDYRHHDRATDVLSFHLQELAGEGDPAGDGINLGDIVISVPTARRRSAGKRLPSELIRLAIHGLCHLFGHDHKRKPEATVMYALERRLRRKPPPR